LDGRSVTYEQGVRALPPSLARARSPRHVALFCGATRCFVNGS
jgi:hypothetical protein